MPVTVRKRFSQHFLERAWAEKLTRLIAPDPGETFLEIGPGRGALTSPLAAAGGRVVAFEIDRDLAAELRAALSSGVTIIEADFLRVTAERVRQEMAKAGASGTTFRVVGNLPYKVASPILFKLIELHQAGLPFSEVTIMLQREVALRLLASAGTRDYGALTILIRQHAHVDPLLRLPPGAFRPSPTVNSSVVRLRMHAPDPAVSDPRVFANLTHAVFTMRRKMLVNALLAYPPARRWGAADLLRQAGIDGRRRPETLEVAELARLSDLVTDAVAGE